MIATHHPNVRKGSRRSWNESGIGVRLGYVFGSCEDYPLRNGAKRMFANRHHRA